jgi:hypothetical protein
MAQQTAMQIMYDELMAHEYIIPLELIIKCKELLGIENEQIMKAFSDGQETPINNPTTPHYSKEEYYNETYNNGK